jgi:hypothetical protein
MKIYLLFIFLFLTLIVAACTSAPAPELRNEAFMDDISLVSGDPCEAPCWQDLIPGETVWGVAQDFVKNNADYTIVQEVTASIRVREARIANSIRASRTRILAIQDGPQCCRILSRDGEILSAIVLLLAPNMQLGDVIERYGEASYVSGEAVTNDQATIALVFPDIPMVTYVFAESLSESEVSAASTVIGIMYLAQSEMDTLLQSENFYNWEGYGLLGNIIDGTFDITPEPQADE